MNRKCYPILAVLSFILTNTIASAQQFPQSYQSPGPEAYKTSKATGIGSRNTGYSRYTPNAGFSTPVDSQRNLFVSPSSADVSESYFYNWSAGAWTVYQKQEFSYSGTGPVNSIIYKWWDAANNLYKQNFRRLYTYKPDGYKTEDLFQPYDTVAMTWVNGSRILYTPDSSNYTTEMMNQIWDTSTNAWVNSNRYNYLFNAQHSTLEQLSRYWDKATSAWRNSGRVVYTYDANGLGKIADTFYTWDIPTSAWRYSGKNTYTVTATSKPAIMQTFSWNISQQSFDTASRYGYSYDASDNETSILGEYFSPSARTFSNHEKVVNTYNSFDQRTSRGFHKWVSGAWSPFNSHYNYYYETFSTPDGIGKIKGSSAEIILSPVPAIDRLDIRIGWQAAQAFTAFITDMQGRVLQTFSGGTGKTFQGIIDISALPAGHYSLSVKGNKGTEVSRMFSVVH